MSNKTILFSGLPGSGKTTYIAALWYFLFESSEKTKYQIGSLENLELEHLNTLSLRWASCEPVLRTNQHKIIDVSIEFTEKEYKKTTVLKVPDISGESFKAQFLEREWGEDFNNIVKETDGLILFIDPRDNKNLPRYINQERKVYEEFESTVINDHVKQPWNEDLSPNQVKLVDFLQMLDFNRPGKIWKISVLVSCWDIFKDKVQNPREWCKVNVPLLYQYLDSNDSAFIIRYFGVSAQGGSYDDVEIKDSLFNIEPLERIKIVTDSGISNDILIPILWMNNES